MEREEVKREEKGDTAVEVFGYGKHGQLGVIPTVDIQQHPLQVPGLKGVLVKAVACGGAFTSALSIYGDVYVWGDLRSPIPHLVSGLRGKNVVKIRSTAMQTFAVTVEGEVYVWGEIPPKPGQNTKPVLTSPCSLKGDIYSKKIVEVACGALHALLLDNTGKVYSYGENTTGQLGVVKVSLKEEIKYPQLISVLEDQVITTIACGGNHSIAITNTSEIWVWGSNKYGQIGLEMKYKMVQVPLKMKWEFEKPVFVTCGDYHTLIATENELYSFGKGSNGQLGTGSQEDTNVPQKIKKFSGKKITMLRAGGGFSCSHSMACTEKGVYGWGSGGHGQLGFPVEGNCNVPKRIKHFEGGRILDVACGWLHTVVLVGTIPPLMVFEREDFDVGARDYNIGRFNTVANDNIIRILSFIKEAKDLLHLGSTCKFFLDFTSEGNLWATMFFRDFPTTNPAINGPVIDWKVLYSITYQNTFKDGKIKELRQLHQIPQKQNPIISGIRNLFIKKEHKILMVGLDAPGKTTILYKLKLGDIVTTIPTIGFNVETVSLHSRTYTLWDVGGPDKIRPLWRHYYAGIDASIFVIDSNDIPRMEEAISELRRLTSAEELTNVPCLIFANKQDLPGALPPEEIARMIGLTLRPEMLMHVQGSIATQGVGLAEGFAWLNSVLDALGK